MTDSDCKTDMECIAEARERLLRASELSNCGYCKEFAKDEADGVLKPFLGIKDNLSLIDQVRTGNGKLARDAYEKSRQMLTNEFDKGDFRFRLSDIFPLGIIPGRAESRPRLHELLDRDIIPRITRINKK